MSTLFEVESSIRDQILRDYGHLHPKELEAMCIAGLAEEAGEVAGIFKREVRHYPKDLDAIKPEHLMEELGDVLWYLTSVAVIHNIPLELIWQENIRKLEERYG